MKPEEATLILSNMIHDDEAVYGRKDKKRNIALDMAIKALKEQRPHGEWSGEPERREMATRVCTACGERSAVGYYCMWCGADMRKEGGEK